MRKWRRLAHRRDEGSTAIDEGGSASAGARATEAWRKSKQHSPSICSGTLSAWACGLVVDPWSCEVANAYRPASSSSEASFGPPTSVALTSIVTVHGSLALGVFGQLTAPFSAVPPELASG